MGFFFFQAPYLEIKKQMDKQDPLAHPLLQWYIISVFLLVRTTYFSIAYFKERKKQKGEKGYFTGPAVLQFHATARTGDCTIQESLMTLPLIKTRTS